MRARRYFNHETIFFRLNKRLSFPTRFRLDRRLGARRPGLIGAPGRAGFRLAMFFFTTKRRIARNRASRGGSARRRKPIAATDATRSLGVKLERLGFHEPGEKTHGDDVPAPGDFPSVVLFCCCVVVLLCCFCVLFCSFPVSLVARLSLLQPNGLGQNAKGKLILFWPAGKSARFAQISQSKPTLPPFLTNVAVFRGRGRPAEIGLPSAPRAARPFRFFLLFGPLSSCLPNGAASPFEPPAF